MDKVNIYIADSSYLNDEDVYSLKYLTKEDFEELDKYRNLKAKKEKAVSFYLKRKYVQDYKLDEYGKPYSDTIRFNVSHSKGLVALAISNKREIGLDLEAIRDPKNGLLSYACSEEEQKYVRDGRSFFEIWTAKESLVKASGRGIDRAAKSIPALPLSGYKNYLDEDYYSVSISFGNYVFSVTLKGKEGFSIINLLNENLEYEKRENENRDN